MSHVETDLKYADSHEWVRDEGEGIATVGVSDHAQGLLGDLVYVELPEVGSDVTATEEAGVVESVKAASDVYSPVSGEVVAVNESLEESPELVNGQPYAEGWLFKVKLSDAAELNGLMSADAYENCIADDEEH